MSPLDIDQREIARLREKIDDLQFENRQLRSGPPNDRLAKLGRVYGLKRTGAVIVCKLWARREYVECEDLAATCLIDVDRQGDDLGTVRTHICYIRRAMGRDAIEGRRGFGYRLSDADHAAITALFTN